MNRLLLTLIQTLLLSLLLMGACSGPEEQGQSGKVFLADGGYPNLTERDGKYYFLYQSPTVDSIILHVADSPEDIPSSEPHYIWSPKGISMRNIYSPELFRIDGKWYIYFEADNGANTDNHQLYVLENSSASPTEGEWNLHGPIITSEEWNFGLHPTTFVLDGRQYLLWSGWPKRRTETETQCIYIAEMADPYTLKSERVMISQPEYEWERQWINPDGSRTAYPIYVNENPEVVISPDGKRVAVAYSASGIWTEYHTLGMLHASTDSDLLDPSSWIKEPEPVFQAPEGSGIYGTSNVSILKNPDERGKYYFLYEVKRKDENGDMHKGIRWKEISWEADSLPTLGMP